jgi:hypothetical protein
MGPTKFCRKNPRSSFDFRGRLNTNNMRNQESANRGGTFRLGSQEYPSYLLWNAAAFAANAYSADFPWLTRPEPIPKRSALLL